MSEATFVVFDCESTGTDVFNDRIVQLVIATADSDGKILAHSEWIIDPGIPIPEEASAIHGFSTEYVQAHGESPKVALRDAWAMFGDYAEAGLTFVAYNLSFDLSIIDMEFFRHLEIFPFGADIEHYVQLFDPLVVDRGKDRYRKGNRKLMTVAGHYGIPLDEAKLHNALYDVEITARVASAVAKKYGIPSNEDQAEMHRAWAENFESYLRGVKGDDSIVIGRYWPLQRKGEQ